MKKLNFFLGSIVVLVLICPAVSSSQATYVINASAPYAYVTGTTPITGWVCDDEGCEASDDGYVDLSLGDFVFKFYGVSVSTLRISTNGYMTFGTEGQEYFNTPIPYFTLPNALIAPFWTDLDLTGLTGDRGVWWGMTGTPPNRQLVIEWYQVPSWDHKTEEYSFEVILYESTNKIKFQYSNVVSGTDYDKGSFATVGVENFDGTSGSQFSYNTPSLSNGLAIEFTPKKKLSLVDFDGDSKTDVTVYDVAQEWWFFLYSSDGSYGFDAIGVGGGSQWVPVPGDYDGDGITDVAVYDTVYGWWLFHYASGGYFYDHVGQGGTGYTAVPGDYDGDGVTDLAVYQGSTGYWFIQYSLGGYGFKALGGAGRIPVQADYDGDGKTDVAVYDVANGWWFFQHSSDGSYRFDAIGVGGGSQWVPVPGDYDGDGKTDVAIYDTVYGWWLFHYASGGYFYDHVGQGGTGYTAVPGDYDGDGVTDLAVYQGSTGYWFIQYSSGGYGFKALGGAGRIPVK